MSWRGWCRSLTWFCNKRVWYRIRRLMSVMSKQSCDWKPSTQTYTNHSNSMKPRDNLQEPIYNICSNVCLPATTPCVKDHFKSIMCFARPFFCFLPKSSIQKDGNVKSTEHVNYCSIYWMLLWTSLSPIPRTSVHPKNDHSRKLAMDTRECQAQE